MQPVFPASITRASGALSFTSSHGEVVDTPWDWCPPRSAWLNSLRPAAERWLPQPILDLDVRRLREFLLAAIDRKEDWLYHPCAVALVDRTIGGLRKDVQLSVWAASHCEAALGSINIPEPLQCWAPAGSKIIPSGVQQLAAISYGPAPLRMSIDPYSLSLGEVASESWGALSDVSAPEMTTIKGQIRSFLSAVGGLESLHPACSRWLCQGVRVAIPLNNKGEDRVRSWSSRTHPGAVHVNICANELFLLEALVHESAHCHLYLQEAFGPLINADEAGMYTSPLRCDPRPLRGILLAYHALAHICAFYSDALARGLGDPSLAMNELRRSRDKLFQAERIIGESESRFTELGKEFVRKTDIVAQYGTSFSPAA